MPPLREPRAIALPATAAPQSTSPTARRLLRADANLALALPRQFRHQGVETRATQRPCASADSVPAGMSRVSTARHPASTRITTAARGPGRGVGDPRHRPAHLHRGCAAAQLNLDASALAAEGRSDGCQDSQDHGYVLPRQRQRLLPRLAGQLAPAVKDVGVGAGCHPTMAGEASRTRQSLAT